VVVSVSIWGARLAGLIWKVAKRAKDLGWKLVFEV
jgi:hypothetical protein